MTANRVVKAAWHIGMAAVLAAAMLAPTMAEAAYVRWLRLFMR